MAEGTEVGTAYVSILPSAAGFGAKLQAQITGQAEVAGAAAGKALGTGITTSASGIVKGVTALFAVVGATRFFKGSIAEAEEAVKVGNLTNAVIKSTGGAAGVTAAQVEGLATSLSKVAGVDDEVIQAGENVLLTFTKVRNQVGAGNDIFNQTTQAALDMSAALGSDLQGSIIQLGKALQDPTQGLLALRRSGVSFTAQQQDQIKALQESGHLLEAQKLILGEVGREFGGAAAAGATGLDKLHVAVLNFEESVGTALMPTVDAAAGGLTSMLGLFNSLPGPIQGVTTSLFGLGAAGVVIGLLAPKIASAREELEGMGRAGTAASRGIGLLGTAGLALAAAGGLLAGLKAVRDKAAELAGHGVGSVPKLTEAIADFLLTGRAVGALGEQFGSSLDGIGTSLERFTRMQGGFHLIDRLADPEFSAARDDIDSLDKTLAGLVSSGHGDAAARFFQEITNKAAAQGVSVKDVKGAFNDYGDALAGTSAASKLGAVDLQGVGDAAAAAGDQAAGSVDSWGALQDRIKQFAATQISDWSNKIAGDLTSALNPMERFGADTAKNVASLKEAVKGAASDLTKAKGDLAKLTAVPSDPVEAFLARGKGATADQIDAANSTITAAAKKLAASQAELAEAQRSPFAKLKENLTANLKTVTDWKANLEKLASRGKVGEALAKDLAGLGPAAAGAVAEATRKSDKELGGMETLFAGSGKIIADAASGSLEAHLDEIGSNGELIATITAKKYQDTLPPKMMAATLAAMDDVQRQLLGLTPKIAGVAPGVAGPAAPPSIVAGPVAPPLINVPGFTMPGTTTNNIKVEVNSTETPEPSHLAKAIAWAL